MNIKNMSIHELRKANFKVRVTHRRKLGKDNCLDPLMDMKTIREANLQDKINAKGGCSTIEVTTPDGKDYMATAKCNPKDVFNRKLAIKKCLGRIVSQIEKEIDNIKNNL